MEGAGSHVAELGTRSALTTRRNPGSALADSLPASPKAPESQGIDAPLTVTISGNLAAAIRWVSRFKEKTPEAFIWDAVAESAACWLTSVQDDEAEQFLSEKEGAA